MGKVTGFMEYERVEEVYKPIPERVKHYKEFILGLDDEQAKVQAARCMDCGIPFCNRAARSTTSSRTSTTWCTSRTGRTPGPC